MSRGEQWRVGQPAWAGWLGVVAACIGAGAVAYWLHPATASLPGLLRVPFSVVASALGALLAFRLSCNRRVTGTLCRSESGSWHFQSGAQALPLQPVHMWASGGWITLQGRARQRNLRLTVWKSAVPPDDWRRLRAHATRMAAMPAQVLGKESE